MGGRWSVPGGGFHIQSWTCHWVATPSLGRGEGALVRSHSGHSFASTDASVWVKLESRYIH